MTPQTPCSSCGSVEQLYRTPRGLLCARCVQRLDSSGLSFMSTEKRERDDSETGVDSAGVWRRRA